MPEIITKAQLRAACKRKRETLQPEEKKRLDRAVCENLAGCAEFRRAKKVFLYVPLPGEIDLIPLAKLCCRQKKTLAFPVTDPRTDRLTFRVLRQGDKLERGAYGIPEPPPDAPVCLPDRHTFCVLPGLCFDREGNRLGYGKGCYDRFLSDFTGVSVGVVWDELLLDILPTEPHDLPVSLIVTDREVVRIAPKSRKPEIPAPLLRAAKRTGEGLKRTADRLHLTEYADKGAKKVRTIAGDLWHRFFRSGEGKEEAKPEGDPKSEGDSADAGAKQEKTVKAPVIPPILVAVTFVLVRLSRLAQDNLSRRGSEYISVILLQVLIFLIPAVIYIRLRGENFPDRIRLKRLRPEHLWLLFCVLVMMVCGSLLLSILTGGIASLTGNFTLYNTFLARSSGNAWETIYLILAFGVLPAFCEELVYRSILCAEYEPIGVGTAITVSTVFFAMLHFTFRLLPVYLWLGALLAATMYATRSVLAPMLLHLAYNLFCLFGQPYLSAFYVNAGSGELFIFCLMVLLLLFSAFAAGEARKVFHRYARREDSGVSAIRPLRQTAKRTLLSLLTPAVAVCFVLWLVFL